MPQKKQTKYSKYNKEESDEYEATLEEYKKLYSISPATVDHLWRMGYTSVKSLAAEKNTPNSLSKEITNYLIKTKKVNAGKPFDYSTVFRRILFASRASIAELNAFPEYNLCKHWNRKGLNNRGLDIGENGCVVALKAEDSDACEDDKVEKEEEEEKDKGEKGKGKRKTLARDQKPKKKAKK